MQQPKATLSVRHIGNHISIIDIQGEVSSAAENALMDAYTEACSHDARSIILNFSRMEYMNSSGIGLLVTLLIRANRQKQKLLTYGLSDHYKQIFELTRLNDAMRIFDTESQAVAAS